MTPPTLRRALRPLLCLLVGACLGVSFRAEAVNRCVVNGSVTFQDAPCPAAQPRRDPTLAELNAAEKARRAAAASAAAATPRPVAPAPPAAPDSFHCDGRQYCSQMRSCAEARYFLAHCPGAKMDGDHNGIPCEKQWCGH